MRRLLMMLSIALVCTWHVSGQSVPVLSGTLKAGGVHSRNMELVGMVPFRPGSGERFDFHTVPYVSGGVSKKKQLLVTVYEENENLNRIRIIDVTNPRQPDGEYITITVRDRSGDDAESGVRRQFKETVVYTDEHTQQSGTFNGDVFMVARMMYHDLVWGARPNNVDKARFIIINLSKAVALRESGTTSLIEIYNAGQRNVKYNGTKLSPANRDIYVGYIHEDATIKRPHTVGCDQKSGIMVLATIKPTEVGTAKVPHAYTDMFDLKMIVSKCTPGNNTLGILDRLKSGGKPIDLPQTGGSGVALLYPHEIVPHYLTDTKVRLFIASFTGGDPTVEAGGVAIVDVDYSDPAACTVSTPKYWPYDADRKTPHKQKSITLGGIGQHIRRPPSSTRIHQMSLSSQLTKLQVRSSISNQMSFFLLLLQHRGCTGLEVPTRSNLMASTKMIVDSVEF